MKKNYQKPDVYFEDFAFSSNIASSCSQIRGSQSEGTCSSYGTHNDPSNCRFYDNGWEVFHQGICLTYPQENNPGNLCYHVSTDETRMFAS
jgi:hypothetical protein